MKTPIQFIREESDLGPLWAEPRLALDTESDPFFRYEGRVCLIQLSTPSQDYIVDPLTSPPPPALFELLADPARTIVLHGADFDVRSLFTAYGLRFGRLLDTSIAARLLGLKTLGLKPLLAAELDVQIDKTEQRSDWGARPLSRKQIAYARQDTRHLLPLIEQLESRLEPLGRLPWLAEECELQRTVEVRPKLFDPEAWRKIKGSKKLGPRGQRALRALYVWREALARARNLPPFRVVRSDPLLRLAVRVEAEGEGLLERLDQVRGLPAGLDLAELAASLREGLAGEDPPPRPSHPRPSPEEAARVDALRAARADWSEALKLDPGFLLPMGLITRIAKECPSDLEGLSQIQGFTGWRSEAIGAEILDTLSESTASVLGSAAVAGGSPEAGPPEDAPQQRTT